MRSRRLTREQREWQRHQRNERNLIMAMASERNFDYVVNPPEIPRVAFGSGLHRETLPMKGPGLSPFMLRHQGEKLEYPGPFEYSKLQDIMKKYASKLGHTAFSSKLPRLPPTQISDLPPIGAYYVNDWPAFPKPHLKPFGVGEQRTEREKFLTPGPATYPIHIGRPILQVSTGFGSHRITKSYVNVICTPKNTANCYKCNKTPVGDYWRNFQSELDMCRPCMKTENDILKQCSTDIFVRIRKRRELELFKPTRYCGFYHEHNGTSAAVRLLPKTTLHFKINKENYLSRYF